MQKRRVVFLRARRPRFLGRLASCFPKQRENRLPTDRTSFLLRPAVFRGVACVCVFHGRFTSRTEVAKPSVLRWSLVWPAFLFVSVQPANLDRPCQAGLCCRVRGWPRATCVFVCVSCSRNRFWNRVCACVCVCVPCQICLKDGSGKTLSVAMEPCLARLVFAADEQWSWGFRTKD